MKLLFAIVLVVMLFVSACGQKPAEEPDVVSPGDEPVIEPEEPTETDVEMPEGDMTPVDEPEEVAKPTTSDEVRILAKGGLEPLELSISAGSAVTWMNEDTKDIVLTFFKDGKFYLNSAVIKPGEKFEHEFTEAGEYEYWTLAYGPQGAKITVK